MFDPNYKFFLVGIGLDSTVPVSARKLCPEGGCGRGAIATAKAGDGFETGGQRIKGSATVPDLLGAIEFDSEKDAQNWRTSRDGESWERQFVNVLLIRSSR